MKTIHKIEMTEAFTAGIMIFIEQFRTRWPWSIGVLESWLSTSSSSSGVPASSILRIHSPRRFVPGCGRHLQEWSIHCSESRTTRFGTYWGPVGSSGKAFGYGMDSGFLGGVFPKLIAITIEQVRHINIEKFVSQFDWLFAYNSRTTWPISL